MNKSISALIKIISLLLICCLCIGGCSLSQKKDPARPTVGLNKDVAENTVLIKGDSYCKEFEDSASVYLSGTELAYIKNIDAKQLNKVGISSNVVFPAVGTAGMVIGTYTDENGATKYIKMSVSAADKKAYLIAYDDIASETIYEYNIKTDLSESVLLTAQYNKGVVSFWIEEEYLFKKEYDLATVSSDFCFYGGFFCDGAEKVDFKYIKIFGVVTFVPFDVASIYEGCTDIVPSRQFKFLLGSAKSVTYGGDKMISTSGANRIEIMNLGLDYSKPIAYSFTLNTIKVDKSWNGFRPAFLEDSKGNMIKIFSLDGSINIFYYDANTKTDSGKMSYTHQREYKTPEEITVYIKDGMMYVFLNGEVVMEYLLPPANGQYKPIFRTLFEFGHTEVTNIKIYQANNVAVY